MIIGLRPPVPPKYNWSRSLLRHVFDAMIQRPQGSARFCLFIDGLDEYEGECGHAEMAGLLRELTASKHLKTCVSGRPWIAFKDEFEDCLGVRLEALNHDDIKKYLPIFGNEIREWRSCIGLSRKKHRNSSRRFSPRRREFFSGSSLYFARCSLGSRIEVVSEVFKRG
jgi:hypothetical protein